MCAENDTPRYEIAAYLLGSGASAKAVFDGETALDRLMKNGGMQKPEGQVLAMFLIKRGSPCQNKRAFQEKCSREMFKNYKDIMNVLDEDGSEQESSNDDDSDYGKKRSGKKKATGGRKKQRASPAVA
uniref:Uncharacterized protein n=1 Tax=Haptolina ericina TaxID=156174 RepID=A0A7S3EW88_9EUKA|mmetsp:Transcript_24463/g.55709  ORF Transcript_24463/g.55709 Transcript_24463/m.55709 type:complete len:128 (+) Transcript_24463:727-1110(+)